MLRVVRNKNKHKHTYKHMHHIINSRFGTTRSSSTEMAAVSAASVLQSHANLFKSLLLTDEYCRTFATVSHTTRAAVSSLEYQWARISFETMKELQFDKLIEDLAEYEDLAEDLAEYAEAAWAIESERISPWQR